MNSRPRAVTTVSRQADLSRREASGTQKLAATSRAEHRLGMIAEQGDVGAHDDGGKSDGHWAEVIQRPENFAVAADVDRRFPRGFRGPRYRSARHRPASSLPPGNAIWPLHGSDS